MKNTLINPFEYYSERILLIVGVFFLVCTVFVMSCSDILLLGSLKVITNHKQSFGVAAVNLLITLGVNILVLFLFGKIRYAKSRLIDVSNVVLMSHIPMYIALWTTAIPFIQNMMTALELEILDKGMQTPELPLLSLIVLLVFGLLMIVLMVAFFYYIVVGMKIAINSKKRLDAVLLVLLVLIVNSILQFLNLYIV